MLLRFNYAKLVILGTKIEMAFGNSRIFRNMITKAAKMRDKIQVVMTY